MASKADAQAGRALPGVLIGGLLVLGVMLMAAVARGWGSVGMHSRETVPAPQPAVTPAAVAATFHQFGSASVAPVASLNGAGSNIDSLAFWEADDPVDSLLFVTAKARSLVEVWRHPYEPVDELAPLRDQCLAPATNGVWVDQASDRLFVSVRDAEQVCVFRLPSLAFDARLDTRADGGTSEPNVTLLTAASGQRRLFVSHDTHVDILDADSGVRIGGFRPAHGLETMFADDFFQALYIPDENGRTGVSTYDADGAAAAPLFGTSVFNSDAEGVWVYRCPVSGPDDGRGVIVVSDQRSALTEFETFDRETKQHLGRFTIPGVNNTDGITSTQQPSPAFPAGIFAAVDDDTSTAIVGWADVFEAISATTGRPFGCPT